MFKMAILLLVPLFFLCSSTVLGQESLQIMTLYRSDSSSIAPSVQTTGVSVNEENLNEVSNSILVAEKWLRAHVLSYYPSSNIKSIVVTNNVLCNDARNREEIVRVTLDSMKNLYYSLTRWGLEREIKVSVSLSLNCVHQSHLHPAFSFLNAINSTYTINPPQFSDQVVNLMISELKLVNNLGVFQSETVNVVSPVLKQPKPTSRKLSFIDNLWSSGSTPPSEVVEFSPAPEFQSPMMAPASSPSPTYGLNLPPCNPYSHRNAAAPEMVGNGGGPMAAPPMVGNGGGPMAAPPMVGNGGGPMAAPPVVVGNGGGSVAGPPMLAGQERLWCVAKPSVPSDKLQVAIDYACGVGGADCGAIKPNGSCFSPDSVVAHASYAFNSYWQKNKKNGGVCGFGGTAMLISSDPSFLHCHFIFG